MIEPTDNKNRDTALSFLLNNPDINADDAKFCVEKSDRVIVYKHDSTDIVGCGAFRLWGKDKNKADAYIYVAPEARREGIGTSLLKSFADCPEASALKFLSTKIETNHAQSLDFFRKNGFVDWYTELILCHSGERQPANDLPFISYSSEYFERYVDVIRHSFYELRKSNDFEPYYCCEPNDAKRDELEKNKDNVYILLDGERLVASVIVNDDYIEDVFVAPEYSGRGIGKKMVQFAINKALDNGSGAIKLSAIEWNKKAVHMYESVGFKTAKTMNYLRLFI